MINPIQIDWTSKQNYFFINPKYQQQNHIEKLQYLSLEGHLWIMTSGRTSHKWVALSKKAFLHSAKMVNQHLKVQNKDRWLVILPIFHVGGLSILARSFLSQSPCIVDHQKWNPVRFVDLLRIHQIHFTSLVPTQLYDVVLHQKKPPSCLKAVVIGGGSLPISLYQKARQLSWPILPSYGCTEVSSQIATASLDTLLVNQYPKLSILPHCLVRIRNQEIHIQSDALLTGWMDMTGVFYPHSKDTWWNTRDVGSLSHSTLQVFGQNRFVKIQGESVSLNQLDDVLLKVLIQMNADKDYQLVATEHPRSGYQIDMVTTECDRKIFSIVWKKFNQQVMPFERVINCYILPCLPKGNLCKIKINELQKILGF